MTPRLYSLAECSNSVKTSTEASEWLNSVSDAMMDAMKSNKVDSLDEFIELVGVQNLSRIRVLQQGE